MTDGPALYVGRLRHRRFRPRAHAFTYRLFMVLLDVDRIDAAMRVSRLTSVNRFNWASFDDRDHLGDPTLPLRARLRADAERHGTTLPEGRLFLLTHLRYLGYNFNPISLYYAFDPDGSLATVIAEVRNTFGGLCTYWSPSRPAAVRGPVRWRTDKTMHVSPFMPMALDYEFIVTPPAQSLVVHMDTTDRRDPVDPGPTFDATLTLERRPWTPAAIRGTLARHPVMTASVIAAIHWEALRLWAKRLPFYPHPNAASGRRSHEEAEA